jgi:hypothetical protein
MTTDYEYFLDQLPFDSREKGEQWIQSQMDTYTLIMYARRGVRLAPSRIDGLGCIATREFSVGDNVGFSLYQDYRTELGRYINHSMHPNCEVMHDANRAPIITIAPIISGDELTVNYCKALPFLFQYD